MDAVIITKDDVEVQRSRNLRGVISRSARIEVRSVGISENTFGEAILAVCWADGSRTFVQFADYRVLKSWVSGRRSFQGANLIVCGIEAGKVTRNNPRCL